MLGVLRGVEESLRQSQAEEKQRSESLPTGSPTGRALMAVDADPAVTARLRRRYPHLRSRKLPGRTVVSDQYQEGIEAGRRIKIHEAVAGGATGKFLPGGKS
jgi:hypothetical protein